MKKAYRTIRAEGKVNEQELTSFLVENGQGLLPMVDLIAQCQVACDELIDMTGRAAIQAVLQRSAMDAAGASRREDAEIIELPQSSSHAGASGNCHHQLPGARQPTSLA